jgi:hypothetical protein
MNVEARGSARASDVAIRPTVTAPSGSLANPPLLKGK